MFKNIINEIPKKEQPICGLSFSLVKYLFSKNIVLLENKYLSFSLVKYLFSNNTIFFNNYLLLCFLAIAGRMNPRITNTTGVAIFITNWNVSSE